MRANTNKETVAYNAKHSPANSNNSCPKNNKKLKNIN